MTLARIVRRAAPEADGLQELHPVLRRVYAARGVLDPMQARPRLGDLLDPQALGGIDRACDLLEDALRSQARIVVVGDFDCDGATGTAVAVRGLRALGARHVDYAVPDRRRHGYGLSPAIVAELAPRRPDLLITVDNGIAAHAGVAAAKARGMRVIVTDHHLPGASLPDADAIIDPNLPGDGFASQALAGVGVMFCLLLALRARLRERGAFAACAEPDLRELLDLVALGTVADLVPLDRNNRILVAAGLQRIRAGRAGAGIAALLQAGKRDPARCVATDLGFVIGPRINAAGRLQDMRIGIECLLADDPGHARELAEQLSAINAQRRELQDEMVERAQATVGEWIARHGHDGLPVGPVLFEPDWHHGVVGLVASKLKEHLHRPVIACALSDPDDDEVKGSGRSIAGFHLRDALAEVDARHPGLLLRFGGHAMAAGLSLRRADLPAFAAQFDAVARARIPADALQAVLHSDGELQAEDFTCELARQLRYAGPWGQGFPEPLFDGEFAVEGWKVMAEKHLRLDLRPANGAHPLRGVAFGAWDGNPPPARIHACYQLELDAWNGEERLQLLIRRFEAVGSGSFNAFSPCGSSAGRAIR